VEKLVQKAEAPCTSPARTCLPPAESEDMYAAIDALADKLDRQLIKHKEKRKAH
jgi:putative sigma-54 modulation protein